MQNVNCNKCREKFDVVSVLTRVLPERVHYNYFMCPHCKTEYYVSYTSVETRRIQQHLNMLRRRVPQLQGNRTLLTKQLKKIEVAANKHEVAMGLLEEKMNNGKA